MDPTAKSVARFTCEEAIYIGILKAQHENSPFDSKGQRGTAMES